MQLKDDLHNILHFTAMELMYGINTTLHFSDEFLVRVKQSSLLLRLVIRMSPDDKRHASNIISH